MLGKASFVRGRGLGGGLADKSIDKEARAGAEQGADAWRAVLAGPWPPFQTKRGSAARTDAIQVRAEPALPSLPGLDHPNSLGTPPMAPTDA